MKAAIKVISRFDPIREDHFMANFPVRYQDFDTQKLPKHKNALKVKVFKAFKISRPGLDSLCSGYQ